MSAPRLKVVEIIRRERPYRLRMPFRFGVITATHGRQAVIAVRIRLRDGREETGYAAEALGAKWFDKNPALSDEANHHQLRKAIELAGEAYLSAAPSTAFGLFAEHYRSHLDASAAIGLNPLVASYGPALLDRAVFDALCRLLGMSFYEATRRNLAGIGPHPIVPELVGFDFGSFLETLRPATTIDLRHTVGLADPITRADQSERVDDGLPETLEEVVSTYGNRYFKVKVSGNEAADLDRLARIAAVLDRSPDPYFLTLDGNEQYETAEAVLDLLERMGRDKKLRRLLASMLYLEQPIKRAAALSQPVTALSALTPVIIDESDGELASFPQARALGYRGVSSKACKGFYKSLLNLARCRVWNMDGGDRYFMSAEDLTCEPGVALQQDLALVNLLGLTHVERNAHHFIDGFDGRPPAEAEAWRRANPDLYGVRDGRVRLAISDGRLEIGSLDCAGFGSGVVPDLDATEAMPTADWPPNGVPA
ncbi:mandelate racemase [Mesorhizobium sp. L-8-3]|uniref:mandelate racemase n=2 Tax=Mesorhizobium sp. L-8-3 TaxID=2744522 RepID=UPI001925E857|nr:mandelate racemase [Mesorhizobium sp. L-8-3]BCH27678.1 mandelate racemase [Mesorhizobium sp. L-8-3]